MKDRSFEQKLEDILDETHAARGKILKVGGVVSMENHERECEGYQPMVMIDLADAELAHLKYARTSLRAALRYLLEIIGEEK